MRSRRGLPSRYGLDGLSGARRAVGLWAILGLLAVYFAGARFAGRAPAFAAALLLGINVATVWYARYPNSEMMQQALLFAALLALARAYRDDDRFFAPVAAVLLGSLLFVRLDSLVVLGAVGASLLLLVADGTRLGWRFLLPLAALLATAAAYFAGPMRAYLAIPMMQAGGAPGLSAALAALVIAGLVIRRARDAAPARVEACQRWAPRVLAVAVAAAAAYAFFLREPVGLLAAHDAYAFRTFGWYVGADRAAGRRRGIRSGRVDAVLERSRPPHRGRARLRLLLLQDSHRSRALLAGAALPAGHPAVCLPDDGGGRIRGVPAPPRAVAAVGSRAREAARRDRLPRSRPRRPGVCRLDVRLGHAADPRSRRVRGPHPGRRAACRAVRRPGPRAGRTQILLRHACAGDAPGLRLREKRPGVLVAAPGRGGGRPLPVVGGPHVRSGVSARGGRLRPGLVLGRHHAGPERASSRSPSTNRRATLIRAKSARRNST